MEQQRALNALAPYLALAKSASSPRAAADLITQATSAPQTYVFAELLQTPNIQALSQSPEYAPYLRLLEIFAWGTIADYNSTPNLPPLNEKQTQKLQHLSLLPLCLSPSTLSYDHLQRALSLSSPRELETLITSAIYANLLTAHLDPLHQIVRVISVAPLRDLAPGSVPIMDAMLGEWEGRCADTLKELEGQIAAIRRKAYDERARQERDDRIFTEELSKAEERSKREAGSSAFGDGGAMGGLGPGEGKGRKGGLSGKWGNILGGRGGKRAAQGADEDLMEVDDAGFAAGGGSRSSKRKGAQGGR